MWRCSLVCRMPTWREKSRSLSLPATVNQEDQYAARNPVGSQPADHIGQQPVRSPTARVPQPLGQPCQRKVPTACTHQRLYIEFTAKEATNRDDLKKRPRQGPEPPRGTEPQTFNSVQGTLHVRTGSANP